MRHRNAGRGTPMSRRSPALAAVVTLAAMAALVATSADAATGHHRTTSRDAATPAVPSRAAGSAGSVAVFGAANGDFQVVRGLTGRKADKSALLDAGVRNAVASAVNPVHGKD